MTSIWSHLKRRRRVQLLLLLIVMLASGFAELVSLGAVLPFLAVLSNPEQLWEQPWVQSIAPVVGYTESKQLVLPATIAFALAAMFTAGIRLVNLWLNERMAASIGSDLSCEAYGRSLYQSYEVHVLRNSSTLISAMTHHLSLTVLALNEVLAICSSLLVSAGLLIGLLLVDWKVALFTAGLFTTIYCIIAITSRRKLLINGKTIAITNSRRVQALQEGLGAIRDVLLDGNQEIYIDLYQRSDRPQRQLEGKNRFISMFPRYSLEAIGLVMIAIIGGLLVMERGNGASVIPLLGAIAIGAQKLLPALQRIYAGWANLKSWNSSIAEIVQLLDQPLQQIHSTIEPLNFNRYVRLQCTKFSYAKDLPLVLHNCNIEIKQGERLGIIGTTGSGKSTLVDILMGLLAPTAGKLLVDGIDLHDPKNRKFLVSWRAAVSHVPQNIYLADSSIAENIAFGIPKHEIDFARVKKAAEQAQIANFIESTQDNYRAFVGERGIRLSGGQRQRIGIARALYKQANVIVLDEATSALDVKTEKAVMKSVSQLSRNLTMIIVAHRISTVKRCDRVVRLEKGAVIASGPPSLILSSDQ